VIEQWMRPGAYQFCGGELDDLFNPAGAANGWCADVGTTAAMYGAMGFASLALTTDGLAGREVLHAKAVTATRATADYMLAQQEVRDTNYGYYRRKARWMSADFKTSGAYQEWIRPETTYFMWRAYQATRDPTYLESMLRHATWMQYKQWDEFDITSSVSMKTFGGSDESFQVGNDNLNGFGANFWSETVGQGVALLEYLSALETGEIEPSCKTDDDDSAGMGATEYTTTNFDGVSSAASVATSAVVIALDPCPSRPHTFQARWTENPQIEFFW
jgi:hypothetical protein